MKKFIIDSLKSNELIIYSNPKLYDNYIEKRYEECNNLKRDKNIILENEYIEPRITTKQRAYNLHKQGCSNEKISEIMNIKINTVRSYISIVRNEHFKT